MQKPWEFFENFDELVYVTDMENYEIVYMNQCALKAFGYEYLEDVKGRKCYDVLQKRSFPCSVCKSQYLKENEFYEWKYHNPVLGRTYLLKDTMFKQDGKSYHMEIAIDMDLQEEQKETIDVMVFTEATINEGLRRALAEVDSIHSIEVFLEYFGHSMGCDRFYIFEEFDEKYVKNTFEWCADGVTAEKNSLQTVPMEDVRVWYDSFENGENIIIANVEDIKTTNPEVYKYLAPQNIQSLVVGPLISNSKIIGFYGVDNPPARYLNQVSDMAGIVGHFLVSMLKKRDLIGRLEKLSYSDQLTGLQNRHALREISASDEAINHVGIIYCDVMGLKRVNDTYGHEEGDALLLRASKCLKNNFRSMDLYRMGGDEFLVLCSNIQENDFYNRIEVLRKDMLENNSLMAIGCLWKEKVMDVDGLITEADSLMYQEKQSYYTSKGPEKKEFNIPKK